MDFYIAAIGRSGSTALANWLTTPPTHVVFHEPNLLREPPTRLLELQLSDWGMSKQEAMAGHWGVKETRSELHDGMVDAFGPNGVILCVRNIRDAAMSLFEKHRRQNLLDRYSDQWTAAYLIQEAEALVRFADRLERERIRSTIFRYEDFGENSLNALADWAGWPGGGDMSRGYKSFDREFELDRMRSREIPLDLVERAAEIAEQCSTFGRRFYNR